MKSILSKLDKLSTFNESKLGSSKLKIRLRGKGSGYLEGNEKKGIIYKNSTFRKQWCSTAFSKLFQFWDIYWSY